MAAASAEPVVALGDVVVVGGGCYGTFYATQLGRARALGKAVYRRLLVVDRDPRCRAAVELGPGEDRELVVADWGEFFDGWLGRGAPRDPAAPDAIVPSPLMPHLMFEWLVRRARARWPGRPIEVRPVDVEAGTPYDALGPDGTRYVSFADWLCPVHCIEPPTCPMIHAPRTWEMDEALERLTARLARRRPAAGPVLFTCRHRVHGVGMFDAATVEAGEALVAEAGAAGTAVDVVVGTVSACHGAVSLLHLGA
ncbi:MAG TPA: hypothetical protein VFS40_03400 [Gemmatimonadales bacterium]|nr:hypothetical protein [Gemmatimonadales bacterium]